MLKRLYSRLPYPLYLRVYYAYIRARYWPAYEAVRQRADIPRLDEIDLAEYKTSDTLFILASGPSINRLEPGRWRAIAACDSVGFNYWLYHSFVPTFYFYEGASAVPLMGEAEMDAQFALHIDSFLKAAAGRAEDYRKVPKVVMDLVQRDSLREVFELPPLFRENLYCARTLPLVARTDAEFGRGIAYLRKRGHFRRQNRIHSLFKHTATLSTLVVLGLKLGYKQIVMCGVDLNDESRFYQDDAYGDAKDVDLYTSYRALGPKHILLRRYGPGSTPVDVVLAELKRQLLDPAGVELFVENPRSELARVLPVAPQELFDAALQAGRRASAARE
jgi:hypothetical protein